MAESSEFDKPRRAEYVEADSLARDLAFVTGVAPDAELARSKFGDIAVLLYPSMYEFAMSILRSPEDAEDVTQQALERAYKNLDRFQPYGSFTGWIMTIVRNLSLDILRANKRTIDEDDPRFGKLIEVNSLTPVEDLVIGRVLLEDILAFLSSQSSKGQASALLLRAAGFDQSQSAALLGISEGAVKLRLHRVRETLTEKESNCIEIGRQALSGELAA